MEPSRWLKNGQPALLRDIGKLCRIARLPPEEQLVRRPLNYEGLSRATRHSDRSRTGWFSRLQSHRGRGCLSLTFPSPVLSTGIGFYAPPLAKQVYVWPSQAPDFLGTQLPEAWTGIPVPPVLRC